MGIDFKPQYEYRIYIPTSKYEDWMGYCVSYRNGYTRTDAVGSWNSEDMGTIKEPITILAVICEDLATPDSLLEIRNSLLSSGEEAVLITRSTIETHGI